MLDALLGAETPLRARLRAMVDAAHAKSAGAWEARGGPLAGAQLSWRDGRLVWRRAGVVVRVFSYGERIRAAVTASMLAGTDAPAPALVVVLESSAVFYFVHTGEEFLQPLFFRLAAVHPVRVGVMFVRAHEPEDSGADALPRAFYLRHVLDDLAPWTRAAAIAHPEPAIHGPMQPFLDADEAVVHVSGARIITQTHSAVRIYTYTASSALDPVDVLPDAPPPRKMPRRTSARRSSRVRPQDDAASARIASVRTPAPPAPFAGFARAHAYAALLEEIPARGHVRVATVHGALYIACGDAVHIRGTRHGTTHGTDVRAVRVLGHTCDAVAIAGAERPALLIGGTEIPLLLPPAHTLGGTDTHVCAGGETARVYVRPSCALAARTLDALCAALGGEVVRAWMRAPGDWSALCAMLGMAPPGGSSAFERMLCDARPANTAADALMPRDHHVGHASITPTLALTPPVATCLHLLASDACLDMRRRRADVPRLAALLVHVCTALGWGACADFWARRAPDAGGGGKGGDAPLDVYAMLHAALGGDAPDLAAAAARMPGGAHFSPAWLAAHCPLASRVCAVYAAVTRGAPAVVEAMIAAGLGADDLAALAPGAALPLEEALRACKLAPPPAWPPAAYALVGRADALAQAGTQAPAPALAPAHAQLFTADDRLAEVGRMLATHVPNTVHVVHPDDAAGEAERQEDAIAAARAMAARTMAQCVGRGMLHLASHPLESTSTWTTPRVCLAVRTQPDGGSLSGTHAADAHEREWPEFHNGAASALEIAHRSRRVDSDWIFAHSGGRSTATHAGFLLGLGLSGHLRSLGRVHAYRYLAPRHALTTIGLVLGIAASFRGSADPAARQVMAVQAAAFLPAGSAPLRLETLTQAAGLLGMGLVFSGTDHRWTAERLVGELAGDRLGAADPNRDAYTQCAGLALGMVCLGKARRTRMDAPADAALITRLRHATDTSPAPAMLALALISLRSGRPDIAALLAPPAAAPELDHVRPDLLLVRALARALVAADAPPSAAWLDEQLPLFLRAPPSALTGAAQIAWYYIRAGACLALGLRHAGTADGHVRTLLLAELREAFAPDDAHGFGARILAAARGALRNVAHVALAAVMAGTGDVDVLRLLRVAHGHVGRTVTYGTHMATHMALGLLFVGGGRFTLGTSDAALAALLAALMPPYAASATDNGAHMPAARHLWVLALEPRLLVARDVASGEAAVLPVSVRGARATRRTAPTLLPPLDAVTRVESVSRRYWPAAIDAAALRAVQDPLQPHVLHVQRRTGYLSYVDDPHGYRSIFVRSSVPMRQHFSAAAALEAHATLGDLLELVAGFDTAPQYAALARCVCRSHAPFAAFLTSILMECLTSDAPALVRLYLALWDGLERGDAAPDGPLFLADVRLIAAHARPHGLLSRALVDLVLHKVRAATAPTPAVGAYVATGRVDGDLRARRATAYRLAALGVPAAHTLRALAERCTPVARAAPDAARAALWHVAVAAHSLRPDALVDVLCAAWS